MEVSRRAERIRKELKDFGRQRNAAGRFMKEAPGTAVRCRPRGFVCLKTLLFSKFRSDSLLQFGAGRCNELVPGYHLRIGA